MKFLLLALVASSAAVLAAAEDAKDEFGLNVVSFDAEKFKAQVGDNNHFVMFYAPW